MIGVLRRAIDRVSRIGAHSADRFDWAIARQATSDESTRNTESENIMPVKNLRDFIQEAKAQEDPYVLDLGGDIGEVTFEDPATFTVEDQFNLAESESPREALRMFLGAEQFEKAWPVLKLLKIAELNEVMRDAREHFRGVRAKESANAS